MVSATKRARFASRDTQVGPALVTGSHTRAALAVVRSLGRANIAVCALGPVQPSLAMWSRYAGASALLPNVERAPRAFVKALAEEAEGRSATVILPCTDAELWAISRYRDLLPGETVRGLPSHSAIARLRDRDALFQLADNVGITTVSRTRIDDVAQREPQLRSLKNARYPVLVRPRKTAEAGGLATRPRRARDIAELRKMLYARELEEDGVVVETSSPGRQIGHGLVVGPEGAVVAEVFRERLRERRAGTGATTCSRTIEPEARVRDMSLALVDALDWRGPIFLEWALSDTRAVLTNVRGRIWDTVQLAMHAGVDVPLLAYRIATGERPYPERRVARAGHTLKWMVGDLEGAFLHAVGDEGRGLRERLSAPFRFARGGVRGARAHADVFAKDDPLPFAFEVQGAGRALREALSWTGSASRPR